MFEQFTDRARKVMALANSEAQRMNHGFIGTEHILLGLVMEGSGVGANVLKNLGVDLEKVRDEIPKLVKKGEKLTPGKRPQTPRAKKIIEYAIEESKRLGHNYIGTEHLLLGVLREKDGLAAHVLTNLGLSLGDTRDEVLNLLGAPIDLKPEPHVDRFKLAARAALDTRHDSFAAVITAAAANLPDGPVTPGRFILALIEAHHELAERLEPLMKEIRAACDES